MALPIPPGGIAYQFQPGIIEWIVILVILAALFLLGPSKIPELARSIGKAWGEFRRGRMEIEREISRELSAADTEYMTGRIASAAKQLGVETAGRREMELKLEIARRIDNAPDATLTDVARTLGVWESGAGSTRLKELIVKSLGV